MSATPQLSPNKVSASQSQEDIKGYEVINDMALHEGVEEDHVMSEDLPPPPSTQIKHSHSQTQQDTLEFNDANVPAGEEQVPVVDQLRRHTRTPEPRDRRSQRVSAQHTPSTPGRLAPFDWEDFESRYQKALQEADHHEGELLAEFEHLVKYFNVWASTSSSHDNERAVKRLQTRTRYVHLSEEKLKQKKEHLSEVVKAFQSALALLSTSR